MGEARASPESTGVRLFCRSNVARTVGFSHLVQRDNPGRLRHDDDRSLEQLAKCTLTSCLDRKAARINTARSASQKDAKVRWKSAQKIHFSGTSRLANTNRN